MDAKKLRIGNYVKDQFEFNEPFQVDSIGKDGINLSATDNGAPYGMQVGEIEYEKKFNEIYGIPLTEEWLLKFGFKKSHNLFYTDYYFDVELFNGHFEYSFENYQIARPSIKLEYVHQLQNLYLALTGEELTITN